MIKKLLACLVAVMCCSAYAAEWYDESTGATWTYTIQDGRSTIVAYNGPTKDIVIPGYLGGNPVVVGIEPFRGRSDLTGSLTIEEGVVEIQGERQYSQWSGTKTYGAFQGCSGLDGELKLPTTVKIIGDDAFSECSGLSGALTIPAGAQVGDSAFSSTGFNSVTISSGATISDYAFNKCTKITSVYVEEGVASITGFWQCTGLTNITLPSTIKEIGDSAFGLCTYLTRINIPEGVTRIESYAFYNCKHLSNLLLNDSVEYIGSNAFRGCSSFTGTFVIPPKVTIINDGCLAGCAGLTGITIPNGVVEVCESVFDGCTSLKTLEMPDSVRKISPFHLFSGCSSLETIRLPAVIDNKIRETGWIMAFNNCSSLKKIEIPEGVEIIDGYDVFYECKADIVFPASLKQISCGFPSWRGSCLTFKGPLPMGYEYIPSKARVSCPRISGSLIQTTVPVANFAGFVQEIIPKVNILSAQMRADDPTIMDVVYRVESEKATVKTRALAFNNGVRSFANVIRPTAFVEDKEGNPTMINIGDAVTANENHTLSWQISADLQETLAKISFEVLAVEDEILPLELVTIPGNDSHPLTIQASWNCITEDKALEALFWLYADKDEGLTLQDGFLKTGDKNLAAGTSVSLFDATVYIYQKLGYSLLDGDELEYVKSTLRLDLSDKSVPHAYKIIGQEND